MWIVVGIVVVAVLIGVGMLIARKNPQVADQVAAVANKAEDAAKQAVDKAK